MFKSAAGIEHPARALQGQRTRGDRSGRRPDPDHVRSAAVGAVERAGRQAARASLSAAGALVRAAQRADHRRVRLRGLRDDRMVGRVRAGQAARRIWRLRWPTRSSRSCAATRSAASSSRWAWCRRALSRRRFRRIPARASWPSGARPCATPARRWTERNEAQRRRAGHSGRQGRPGSAAGAAAPDLGRRVLRRRGFRAGDAGPHHGRHRKPRRSRRALAGRAGGDRRRPAARAHSDHHRSARHRLRQGQHARSDRRDARSGAARDRGLRRSSASR